MNPQNDGRRPITVFGAGVAGLTAAHELVERGFTVEVIDPDINEEIRPETFDRGIGGMARSQWVCRWGVKPLATGDWARMEPSPDFLLDETIVFEVGNAAPVDPARAATTLDRLAALFKRAKALGIMAQGPITIFAPTLPGAAPNAQGDSRIVFVQKELARRLGPELPDFKIDGFVVFPPVTSVTRSLNFNALRWVYFGASPVTTFPAEHGFRFFPSFYRHLFDTMARTPIIVPTESEAPGTSVYDNLRPSDGLGLARSGKAKALFVPRTEMRSIETLRKYLKAVLEQLGYELGDLALLTEKVLKYMTSSSLRRRDEYENISWGQFLETERYSPQVQLDIENSPKTIGALRGSQSDARTQGNILIQLLMNQFTSGLQPDCTLDGPTSSAWFDHWHDYLVGQGVTFRRGSLERFQFNEAKNTVDPVVTVGGKPLAPIGELFVLALPLVAMSRLSHELLIAANARPTLQSKLTARNDFERAKAFVGKDLDADLKAAAPVGPLQHLSGVQLYFKSDVRFWRGHTEYLDSAWGLTSISQPQFWARSRGPLDRYRSILSVDLGAWDKAVGGLTAWDAPPTDLAKGVWSQIRDGHLAAFQQEYGPGADIEEPLAFAIDQNLQMGPASPVKTDKTPFLVNRVGAYRSRPGALVDDAAKGPNEAQTSKAISRYEVHLGRYVLAGTHMQTYTRITSMESANESARHAVNALLQYLKVPGDRCDIWDPEDNEVLDLQWLRDLDEKLFRSGRPHFVDIGAGYFSPALGGLLLGGGL